jgi:6-phosphofructokinase 2
VGAILVSIGAGGAVLVRPSLPPLRLRAPTVDVRSAVGAGDSMVGGLATGLARGMDLEHAAALGVAAGTAAVMTPGTALCSAAGVEELLPLVTVD